MKYSFSFLFVCVLSFIIVFSCSTEEEESVAPVVQTPEPEPVEYTLTVSAAEGGTVSTEGGTYEEGTEVTINATPSEGYRFIGWEGIDSNENTVTLTLNSDTEISPIFNLIIQTPTSYGVDEYWGKIVDFEPELFFANDISQNAQEQFRRDINLGITEWGNYGPLEYWILGNDINAAIELAELYCEKRSARGELWYFDSSMPISELESICLSEKMHPHADLGWNNNISSGGTYFTGDLSNYKGGFESYREVSDYLPSLSAGLNGHRQWGFHFLNHSLPFQYDENEFNIPKEDNTIVVLHEYFHVVNSANVFSKDFITDETGNSVRPDYGPMAMSEGSANYLSNFLIRKLINDGVYEKSDNWNHSLRDEMKSRMSQLKDMLVNCPNFNLSDLNYGNVCDPYTFGMWGIAYILNRAENIDAYQQIMFPLINDLGYYGAFEEAFGITFEAFNQEFLEFLELPIEEQLEIIPDI